MSETELIRGTKEDHISAADVRHAETNSESLMAKAQLVGLGSVLIVTVTFAAAFTLPGGTDQETGTPILGGKYLFRAFVLADLFAFVFSFFATTNLIHSSWVQNSDRLERSIDESMDLFTSASWCMFLALGLGLYLVLAPLGYIGSYVRTYTTIMALVIIATTFRLHYKRFRAESKILTHIPYVASDLNPKSIRWFIYPYLSDHMWVLYLGSLFVLILVFLVAAEGQATPSLPPLSAPPLLG